MFNEFLILEVFLFIFIIFIIFSKDNFFLLLNSIILLLWVSLYVWSEDVDIFINFLLIIDLGLFLILFSYLLNSNILFSQTKYFSTNIWFFFITIFIFFILFYFFFFDKTNYYFNIIYSIFSFLFIFYNWYNILNFIYFSDLQLLAEVYFTFNLFEFILMNFYLYIIIIIVYYLITISSMFNIFYLNYKKLQILFKQNINIFEFFKVQNLQKQKQTPIRVRIWTRKKYINK